MARVRIIVYAMLVITAFSNVNNSGIGMHTATRYQGQLAKAGPPQPVVHSKEGILSQVILIKARAAGPEKRRKAGISHSKIHSQPHVSHPEESSKARIHEELSHTDSSSNQQGQGGNEVNKKDTNKSMVCSNEKTALYLSYSSIVVSSLCLIFLVYIFITDRKKYALIQIATSGSRVLSDECDGEGLEFDVFVCYNDTDSKYVEDYLIPELERRHYKVCCQRRDFLPGTQVLNNIHDGITKSKRTLVFYSNEYHGNDFCRYEFNAAYTSDIVNNRRRLITIKDTWLDMTNYDAFHKYYFQIQKSYIKREDDIWKPLEYRLARKRMGE